VFTLRGLVRPGEADILEVAERLGAKLRKGGKERMGPCPKCGGRDRFSVNPGKQIFNCRGCQTGGDVIDLVRLVHDLGLHRGGLGLGAISVASAMFLILDLTEPYSGLFRVPASSLEQAIEAIGK
jgi:hypothetical protein